MPLNKKKTIRSNFSKEAFFIYKYISLRFLSLRFSSFFFFFFLDSSEIDDKR